jgi:hypothetical protein
VPAQLKSTRKKDLDTILGGNMSQQSLEESYETGCEVVDSERHTWRTEFPNIIFDLGLDCYQLAGYLVLKQTAADKGSCFKSIPTLAKQSGMSENKFRDVKKSLSLINEILGKPLIRVQPQTNSKGDRIADKITIEPIWVENMQAWLDKKKNKSGSDLKGGGSDLKGGGSDPKGEEEPLKKNPLRKQQQGAAAPNPAAAVFFCLQDIEIPNEDKEWISAKYDEETVKNAVAWATNPAVKITQSLQQAIKWACKDKPKIPMTQEDLTEQNKAAASVLQAGMINAPNAYMEILHEGVEIGYTIGQVIPTEISWTSGAFVELVEKAMKKHGLR